MEAAVAAGSKSFTFTPYYRYLEILVLACLGLLVSVQLVGMLSIDVWRQDSLHYVSTYADKLSEEGRWINYLFFNLLRITPPAICILLSYLCLGYFVYEVSQRVVKNEVYSLCLALLALTTPVLSVQLEWPDTLLIGFVLLVVAAFESKRIPDYIFFPIFSCLFFGTFSAFYFLLPLLFINNLNTKSFLRLLAIWVLSFVFGYCVTNLVIYVMTGDFIQIASWRRPHPAHNISELLENVVRVTDNLAGHIQKYIEIIRWGSVAALLLLVSMSLRSLSALLGFVLAVICALAVYYSSIKLGIIVQARSSLTFVVAIFVAFFLGKDASVFVRSFGLLVMLVIGTKMGTVSYNSVSSYERVTDSLVSQIKAAVPYPPAEVEFVYIVVNSEDARSAVRRIEKNIDYKNYFSDDFSAPLGWLSPFKFLGYKNFTICLDGKGWACDEAVKFVANLEPGQQGGNVFRSYRFGNDVIFTVNK